MRVLHVGFGFRPWRSGGLILYAEDLMDSQVSRGDIVGYFFSGRHYPVFRGTRLRRWRRSGVLMYEVINSPIHHGGDRGSLVPELDLNESRTEALFRQVLESFRPDIVHIQELAGLPTSLIQIVHEASTAPVVMTLQDYYALCPTLKLYDCSDKDCVREDIGERCTVCCRQATSNHKALIHSTVTFEVSALKERVPATVKSVVKPVLHALQPRPRAGAQPTHGVSQGFIRGEHAAGYQHRRETNRARLREVDLLVAQSARVGQLYQAFGAVDGNLHTLNLTLAHLQTIHPHPFRSLDGPMRFVTLNGCCTRPKGAHIMLDALRRLATLGFVEAFELHAWGGLSAEFAEQFRSFPNFRHHGWYKPDQLNAMLDDAHVGIIPSVWEEAYGFVGLEYLAKGVPIIGNAKGGITDYTRDGETGWLNRSNDGAGLAALMEHCISHPEHVLALNREIIHHRSTLLKGMSQHRDEIDLLYREAAERRRARKREALCAG